MDLGCPGLRTSCFLGLRVLPRPSEQMEFQNTSL
jgi:hypothetical protein